MQHVTSGSPGLLGQQMQRVSWLLPIHCVVQLIHDSLHHIHTTVYCASSTPDAAISHGLATELA
jgi:hypothetical protein